ncbi:hypothetical protein B4U84_25805 [Westiellopsis prolifica IICB1]|nr:hypothetical protein B4U84_25805 [Westiellopsis prolifica IICB1]
MYLVRTFKLTFAIAIISLIILITPFSLIHTQNAIAQPAQVSNAEKRSPDDIEFKRLIDESFVAWNTLDADATAKFYAQNAELIFYDLTPLKNIGWKEYADDAQKYILDKVTNFHLSANDDLKAVRKGNFAWTTFTFRMDAQLKNGQPIKLNCRQTDVWERRNGVWLIVHEHASAPLSILL